MSFTPRRVELAAEYLGQTYTLVFDMETVARYEEATDRSLIALLQGWQGDAVKAPPKLSDLGQILLAALGEHHPELTRSHAMEMIMDPGVQALFNEGLAASMPQPGDDGEDTASPAAGPINRRARRAAKGSAGKTGSSSRSKPGSARPNSGGQRRAS